MSFHVSLRSVSTEDLGQLERVLREPEILGLDWDGFSDVGAIRRRHADDGFLGDRNGALAIDADGTFVGQVSWRSMASYGPRHQCWGIGIVIFPEHRRQGYGWRGQRMLAEYLFASTTVNRVEATTRADNMAEQGALKRAGFTCDGTIRGAQFRDGAWRDVVLYGLLRSDLDGSPTATSSV